jgi:hypothetical protein
MGNLLFYRVIYQKSIKNPQFKEILIKSQKIPRIQMIISDLPKQPKIEIKKVQKPSIYHPTFNPLTHLLTQKIPAKIQ